MGVSFAPAKRAAVAAPQARAGPLPAAPPRAAGSARTAHRGLAAAGLACLFEHLGNEALAPVLRGAGADAEIVVAAVGHGCAPASSGVSGRAKHADMPALRGPRAPSGTAAKPRARYPMQTGFRCGPVPRPFVLPSAFAPRSRSGHRRPGALLHPQPAHRRTRRWTSLEPQAERVRGKTPARRTAAPKARMHAHCTRDDTLTNSRPTPDGTTRGTAACSESTAIMGVSPSRPDAQRRSRRMR